MRNELGNTEFDGTTDAQGHGEDPLGEAPAAPRRTGARATILAGLTLGTLGAAIVTANISTVVSNHGTIA